jgi:hypothetical protein
MAKTDLSNRPQLSVISFFGLLGNVLSIYVLLKPSLRGIFSNVLTGLATFDALFLLGAIVTFGMPHLSSIYQVSSGSKWAKMRQSRSKCVKMRVGKSGSKEAIRKKYV